MDIENVTPLDTPIDETTNDKLTSETLKSEAPPPEAPPADKQPAKADNGVDMSQVKSEVSQQVVDTLMTLANQSPNRHQQRQTSALEGEINTLLAQGMTKEQVAQAIKFQRAVVAEDRKELEDKIRAEFAAQQQDSYAAGLASMVSDALEDVGSAVDILKNAGEGLKGDLATQMDAIVESDPAFRDIKAALDSGRFPNKNRVREVAARVVDNFCERNNITKSSKGIDIKSSKPEPASDTDFDIASAGRQAQHIYHLSLKSGISEAEARKRARSVM